MNTTKTKQNAVYMEMSSWQELYILTEYWLSDMAFYKDEVKFLNDLIDKYFIWMTYEENLTKVQGMLMELTKISKHKDSLTKRIKEHLSDIGMVMENAFSHDEYEVKDAHAALEEDIADFVKDFRRVKKEIFTVTDHVLESEKLRHLLTA